MRLSLPNERRAYRIPDKKGERAVETTIPAGVQEFVEIPNPDGVPDSPWLVLAADPKVGLAKKALLMTPGLKVVPEPKEPPDSPSPPSAA